MFAIHILEKAVKKIIGTVNDTNVWKDDWIPTEPARQAKPRNEVFDPALKVHHLIDHERKQWNVELVNTFIAEEDVQESSR